MSLTTGTASLAVMIPSADPKFEAHCRGCPHYSTTKSRPQRLDSSRNSHEHTQIIDHEFSLTYLEQP